MEKEIATQVQEIQKVPNRINPRWNTPRHILIKLTKIKHKQKTLKPVREKQQITHKGIPIRITANLSIETLQARREWQDIPKVMEEKSLQPRFLDPATIPFKHEGEIKNCTDKQKLREFSTTKPALQQTLKNLLYTGNIAKVIKHKNQNCNQKSFSKQKPRTSGLHRWILPKSWKRTNTYPTQTLPENCRGE